MSSSTVFKESVLTERQSKELADNIGNLLLEELDKQAVKANVDKAISRFVTENKLNVKPAELSKRLEWSVKVNLKSKA